MRCWGWMDREGEMGSSGSVGRGVDSVCVCVCIFILSGVGGLVGEFERVRGWMGKAVCWVDGRGRRDGLSDFRVTRLKEQW